MLQAWHRWREPVAVLLLVALSLMLVLRGIGLSQAIAAGTLDLAWGGIPGGDDLLLLVAAAAVVWCAAAVPERDGVGETAGASPHARGIAVAGLLVIGLTVFGWLALSVWGVVSVARWPTPNGGYVLFVIEGILRLVIPAVALGMALLAVGRTGAARRGRRAPAPAELPAATPPLPAKTAESSSDGEVTPASADPERLPAAWHVDEAAGAVWLTADDAAQGRPGLSWSRPEPEISSAAEPAEAPRESPPPIPSSAEDDDLR